MLGTPGQPLGNFVLLPSCHRPLLSSVTPVFPFTSLKESPPPIGATLKLLASAPYTYAPSSLSLPPSVFPCSHLLPGEYQRHPFILAYEGVTPYPNSTPHSSVFKEASPPSVKKMGFLMKGFGASASSRLSLPQSAWTLKRVGAPPYPWVVPAGQP